MYEISKADWKLFCKRVPDWQERHMEKLIKGYIKLLNSDGLASDRFWELEKRIKKDKSGRGVMIELEKSEALWDIAAMVKKKIITMDDLAGFSEALKEAVNEINNRR